MLLAAVTVLVVTALTAWGIFRAARWVVRRLGLDPLLVLLWLGLAEWPTYVPRSRRPRLAQLIADAA